MNGMKNIITTTLSLLGGLFLLATVTSCNDFIFGKVEINEENNPLIQKKTPSSGAETYYGTEAWQHVLPIDKNAQIQNPDPDGAFADWYTCLVMVKEGHPHGGGKMHGNNVYERAAWRQEQFAQIKNTAAGPVVEVDAKSVSTLIEQSSGMENPNYFRIVGGSRKLWGLCFYFYNKEGKLINDSILNHSDEYQIFFTISDKDENNKPYDVLDVRYDSVYNGGRNAKGRITGVAAKGFENLRSFEERAKETQKLFRYVYRDTWRHNDMGDGTRDLYNIKLLPPLTYKQHYEAVTEDQDCVGLKGYFMFDLFEAGYDSREWPLALSGKNGFTIYKRQTYMLPKFCMAVRIMKCKKGSKAKTAIDPERGAKSAAACAPYYTYNFDNDWKEIIRFNLPIKVFSTTYDSDPTNIDPYEPHYYHISREIGLSPEDAMEIANDNAGSGGLGYGAWFL